MMRSLPVAVIAVLLCVCQQTCQQDTGCKDTLRNAGVYIVLRECSSVYVFFLVLQLASLINSTVMPLATPSVFRRAKCVTDLRNV